MTTTLQCLKKCHTFGLL